MGIEWVPVDAFHMPELPAQLGVDPVLAALLHMAMFMEFSGEKTVDFDESITAMESMAYYLKRLSPKQVKEIRGQLMKVAALAKKQKWKKGTVDFIENFLDAVGIE